MHRINLLTGGKRALGGRLPSARNFRTSNRATRGNGPSTFAQIAEDRPSISPVAQSTAKQASSPPSSLVALPSPGPAAAALTTLLATSLAAAPSAMASMSSTANELTLSIPGIVGDDPVREGFVSGFFLIFFSELGDKTFFLALLLALQASQSAVFVGTFGALAVMTVISVGLGVGLHEVDTFLPFDTSKYPVDDLLAVALLLWFGIRTLSGANNFTDKANEEREEAEEVVEESNLAGKDTLALVLSTFALVFAAEWGDKSFLATIALAAASSPVGVVGGAVAGHGVATALAVLGGGVLSKYVSEKFVAYVGGSLFLVFAAATMLDIVRQFHID